MEIERRKVEELKAAEYNPRKDLKPGDTINIRSIIYGCASDMKISVQTLVKANR